MADDSPKTSKRRKTGGTKAPAKKARAKKRTTRKTTRRPAQAPPDDPPAAETAPTRRADPPAEPARRRDPPPVEPAPRRAEPPTRAAASGPAPTGADAADPLADFFYSPDEGGAPGALLAAPAEALVPTGDVEDEADTEAEYLAFWLADELYAVPVAALREIVRPLPVTDVPRTPPWILGVVTLRGTVLPVFDLRLRLGLPAREETRSTRVLVLEGEDGHAGILADRVDQVVRAGDDLEPAPGALGGGSEHIDGLLRREGRMIIVLNLDGALRVDDRRARETA